MMIVLEIMLTFLLSWKTTSLVEDRSGILPTLLILILLTGVFFLLSFIFTFLKHKGADTFLSAAFKSGKAAFIISLVIISVILLCSVFILITADIARPQVYSRFNILLTNLIDPEILPAFFPYAVLGFVLFWEILILFSYTRKEFEGKPKYWIGLPFVLAANFILRYALEEAGIVPGAIFL